MSKVQAMIESVRAALDAIESVLDEVEDANKGIGALLGQFEQGAQGSEQLAQLLEQVLKVPRQPHGLPPIWEKIKLKKEATEKAISEAEAAASAAINTAEAAQAAAEAAVAEAAAAAEAAEAAAAEAAKVVAAARAEVKKEAAAESAQLAAAEEKSRMLDFSQMEESDEDTLKMFEYQPYEYTPSDNDAKYTSALVSQGTMNTCELYEYPHKAPTEKFPERAMNVMDGYLRTMY